MKRLLTLILLSCMLGGCAASAPAAKPGGIQTADNHNKPENTAEKADISAVDIDLTTRSSTMVYAEINNMLTEPAPYLGKVVKLRGRYSGSYYEQGDTYYHFAVIEDALACCAQGLEFIWEGDHTYPDDYPKENEEIEVIGIFDSYDEDGFTYFYLRSPHVEVIGPAVDGIS